jgi:hypothetical protein
MTLTPEDTAVEETALDCALQNSRLVVLGVGAGTAVAFRLQLFAPFDGSTFGQVLQHSIL